MTKFEIFFYFFVFFTNVECHEKGSAIGKRCSYLFRYKEYHFKSPGYPNYYPNNSTCVWKIIAEEGWQVHLTLLDLSIENSKQCQFDSITIYDGDNELAIPIQKYCGDIKPEIIRSISNILTVVFQTDLTVNGKGFQMNYKLQPGCRETFTTPNGTIQSPGYPLAYPDHLYCTYHIKNEENKYIKINVVDFDLEEKQYYDCFDHMSLFSVSKDASEKLIGQYCGRNVKKRVFCIKEQSVTIRFVTDDAVHFGGFQLKYEISDTMCEEDETHVVENLPSVVFMEDIELVNDLLDKELDNLKPMKDIVQPVIREEDFDAFLDQEIANLKIEHLLYANSLSFVDITTQRPSSPFLQIPPTEILPNHFEFSYKLTNIKSSSAMSLITPSSSMSSDLVNMEQSQDLSTTFSKSTQFTCTRLQTSLFSNIKVPTSSLQLSSVVTYKSVSFTKSIFTSNIKLSPSHISAITVAALHNNVHLENKPHTQTKLNTHQSYSNAINSIPKKPSTSETNKIIVLTKPSFQRKSFLYSTPKQTPLNTPHLSSLHIIRPSRSVISASRKSSLVELTHSNISEFQSTIRSKTPKLVGSAVLEYSLYTPNQTSSQLYDTESFSTEQLITEISPKLHKESVVQEKTKTSSHSSVKSIIRTSMPSIPSTIKTVPSTITIPRTITTIEPEPEPKVLEPEPKVIEPESKVLEPKPKVLEPEPKVLEPEPKVLEPEFKVLKHELKVLEPEPKVLEPKLAERKPSGCTRYLSVEVVDGSIPLANLTPLESRRLKEILKLTIDHVWEVGWPRQKMEDGIGGMHYGTLLSTKHYHWLLYIRGRRRKHLHFLQITKNELYGNNVKTLREINKTGTEYSTNIEEFLAKIPSAVRMMIKYC